MNKLIAMTMTMLLVGATSSSVSARGGARDQVEQGGRSDRSEQVREKGGETQNVGRENRSNYQGGGERGVAGNVGRGDRGNYQGGGERGMTENPGRGNRDAYQGGGERGVVQRGVSPSVRSGDGGYNGGFSGGISGRPEPRNERYDGRAQQRGNYGNGSGRNNGYSNRYGQNQNNSYYDGRNYRNGNRARYDTPFDRRHNRSWNGYKNHDWTRGPYYYGYNWGKRYRAPSYYSRPYGYYSRSWQVGYTLPRSYYGSSYYVDYRPYGLAPPPYGYRWIRVDNDVFLVAIASGLIADIVSDFYYY